MNLMPIKFIFPLIMEGEKTSRELADDLRAPLYAVSYAMGCLYKLNLVKRPEGRPRSWAINTESPVVHKFEKLLLVSKNDAVIRSLFLQPSVVRIAAKIKDQKEVTIESLVRSTGISRPTVISGLKRLVSARLLHKKSGKPNLYYPTDDIVSTIFFESCLLLMGLFSRRSNRKISMQKVLSQIKKEDAVLILANYGSHARGTGDKFSDIDLFVVTRDRIQRGDILSKYSKPGIDLSVYSKSGFLNLLKSHPDFVSNIAKAKILKGKDILDAVAA